MKKKKIKKEALYFVYLDYTLEEVERVFYCGKGKSARIKKKDRNQYWKNITAKYGQRREVILATKDEEYAFEIEIAQIYEHKTFEPDWKDGSGWGANLSRGGEGRSGSIVSNETRAKIGLGNLGKTTSEETKLKLSIAHTGKTLSDEHKQKLSEAHKGKTHSEEWSEHMSIIMSGENNPMFGTHLSEAQKRHLSEINSGENNPMWGEHLTDEHKKKLSEGKMGAKNPMYGKTLTTEEKENLSLKLRGENNHSAKLSEANVIAIKLMLREGGNVADIAFFYRVSKSTISAIRYNINWKHIIV